MIGARLTKCQGIPDLELTPDWPPFTMAVRVTRKRLGRDGRSN
jgi:hypothetical protein